MGSCRTGRHHIGTFSFAAQSDGYISSRHIADHHRNQHRAHSLWSFCENLLMLFFHAGKSADTGTDDDADAVRIFLLHLKTGIFHRLCRCDNGVLGECLHTFGGFEIHSFFWNESFNLSGNFYFIISSIKLGDRSDTNFLFLYSIPEFFQCISDWCDRTHSCDDNSSFFHLHNPFLLFHNSGIKISC